MIQVGQQFNNWKVIEIVDNKNCLCECQCEKHTRQIVPIYNLVNGRSKSCGCTRYTNKKKDLKGQQFGDWTVVKMLPNRKALCRCVCGEEKELYHSNLTRTGGSYKCQHVGIKGQRFGNWLILEELGGGKVLCQCQCENKTTKELYKSAVISGETKSCGCMKSTYLAERATSLEGKHFGYWEVLKCTDLHTQKYLCKCVCGTLREVHKEALIHDRSKSCGCKQGENIKKTIEEVYGGVYPQNVDLTSQTENEIASYIKNELGLDIIESCRDIIAPYEIDIYIPDRKIGIEYNGNYWHSSKYKGKHYHVNKSRMCSAAGVRLIHIFEYEWNNNSDIIKQYLKDTLIDSKNKKTIYARDTEIINTNNEIAKNFISKYHLQGYTASEINIGLLYNNELVGMMTFGKPRFNNDIEYELIRLCFKSGYIIVGGAEKMFNAFLSYYKPQSVLSYCNIAKFSGQVYTRLGFKLCKLTEPNYVWCLGNKIKRRYETQKHILVAKGLGTEEQTEDEIMQSHGYVKLYDCGNAKFIWENPDMDIF